MTEVFQAFIDDSYSKNEFVLAGYVAPASTWTHFASDWEQALHSGTRSKGEKFHFKMSEMARFQDRMKRVRTFYDVIEKYPELYPISFRIHLDDFTEAQRRLGELCRTLHFNFDLRLWTNKFFFAYHALLTNFHKARQTMLHHIPRESRVDFIFDTQSERKLLPAWDEYVASHPEAIQRFFGAAPRFEDDRQFLPLQAADLWAWWVREWYEEENTFAPNKLKQLDFGGWHGVPRKKLVLAITEDQIFDQLREVLMVATPHAIVRDFYGPA